MLSAVVERMVSITSVVDVVMARGGVCEGGKQVAVSPDEEGKASG